MRIEEYNIALHDVHVYAHHGVMSQERVVGAWFTLDIDIALSDCSSAYSDDITDTVSYAEVYDILLKKMATPFNLLEAVCKSMMETLFELYPTIIAIEIKMVKDTPTIGGDRLQSAVRMKAVR